MNENQLPGTSDWRIASSQLGGIEGFVDHVSVKCGAQIKVFVSSSSPGYRLFAYRMGYYGGAKARLVWQSQLHPSFVQPTPPPDPQTNMIQTQWQPSLSINIDGKWPPGDYLMKLVTADGAHASYIPLTVRDDQSTSALIIQNEVATWQAYNNWGGYSLYRGPNGYDDRSRVASFDRPYAGAGDGQFIANDLPLVTFAEENGYDVGYWTDIDLHKRPALLLDHKALITLSHDEYWSTTMRSAAESALGHGINLAFFGANDVYQVTRFGRSPLGPARQEIVYRTANEDPLYGVDNSNVTVRYRDDPIDRPEQSLVGEQSDCGTASADGDMVITNADAWMFQGSGATNGNQLFHLVGYEFDRVWSNLPTPPGLEIVAHSPMPCAGRSPTYSDMTYYAAPSGAGVLSTGTVNWICTLDSTCVRDTSNGEAIVRRVTCNVLSVFGEGPAGPDPAPSCS